MQYPLITPESDWSPPEQFPRLDAAKRIAVDLETHDPNLIKCGAGWARDDGRVAGVALATEDAQWYFPVGHEGGGNLDRDKVFKWLRHVLADKNQDKVFANASYDVGWLLRYGVLVEGRLLDVQVAEPLIDEHRSTYRLDSLAEHYLAKRKDERLLREAASAWGVDAKSGLARLPSSFVGPYAEQDARITYDTFAAQEKILTRESLDDVFDLETELLPLTIAMRWGGVRVDLESTERLIDEWGRVEKLCLELIYNDTGLAVDPWSARSIAKLCAALREPFPRSATGEPSFRGEWLEAHNQPHLQGLATVRKLNKARSTFLESGILTHQKNGRVHPEWHPLRGERGGTVSGRYSCSHPNVQQIPTRDPQIGQAVRKLFLPEEGKEWVSVDYSQQEPRLMVHFAVLENLRGAEEARQYYREDPSADYHSMVAQMANIDRKSAKTINLGLAYGMGRGRLAEQLNLDDRAAAELFNRYHSSVPFVSLLAEKLQRTALATGVIKTLAGRRCRFPFFEPTQSASRQTALRRGAAEERWPNRQLRRAYTHLALNRLVQGSAADMTKIAMRDLWREGIVPTLQVHDELCLSVDGVRQAEQVMDIMRNAVGLRVPVQVDAAAGPTWGDAV